ncbi:type II secretion system minor pseudopilin GspJ [Microbulbifer sp. OS29]|uniref:Type II secretion system protein J n=1 Tax=Microbulbifer okhotskensis TaxID=2926617 RepID=A0A9X2ENV9_9GAMM|nr:type II secretion system minor pseudopilin GspJ [Microbulbifer okhotskensis]MCO1335126.1 type II secretion system minor pseudopilin GspJ [Microbulbifer okhotskensis]
MINISKGRLHHQAGFTLVEVLVVLVLVAIISVGSFSLLGLFFDAEERVDRRAEELRRLSMALYRLDSDLRQVTARAVKNAYSGYEPALSGDEDEFEFTRLGAANLTGEPRGELLRLGYSIGYAENYESGSLSATEEDVGGLLLRSRWRVLDRSQDSEPVSEPLIMGVDSLSIQYLDPESDAWVVQWPPLSNTNPSTPNTDANVRLPKAIEIVIVTRKNGEIRRVFPLSSAEISAPPDP